MSGADVETVRDDVRFAMATILRDWIHETPLSLCGPSADTCPDWKLAFEVRDLIWPSVAESVCRVAEAEKALAAMSALERWLALQYPNSGTVREETVIRRCLWALRGSNDEPPHPDRSAR